jgi:7-carboxy-7-deazaguanine synthase
MKRYHVKEAFFTLQGEGCFTGAPAVFVRFTGCNIWSGREQDRQRDAVSGGCALWCDTDFRGTDGARGGSYQADELAALAAELWPGGGTPMVVLTGGEPGLQIDPPIVDALHRSGFRIHVETNGTVPLPEGLDWLTVSPKPPSRPLPRVYDEVKVVLCGVYDPEQWRDLAPNLFLQPQWSSIPSVQKGNEQTCIEYIMTHPWWRLSLQTHKMVGLA